MKRLRYQTTLLPRTLLTIGVIYVILAHQSCDQKVNSVNSTGAQSLDMTIQKVPDQIDFTFHVKPILSDKCFTCHGPDEKKVEAGLQLHTEEKAMALLKDSKSQRAIVPGDPNQSVLVHRIYSDDENEVMPPPESNLDLAEYEKEILKKWIAQGAKWKKHWSFVPPIEPEVPKNPDHTWPSNPIDHFVLEKQKSTGLSPSPRARSEKLIRRLSFDLTGLPPSTADIESFVNDDSTENYERLVDQYLTSNAYAERMANGWLDLARYADTHGYQDDLERTMWPWRDWVIHAFGQNMPYDKFVEWQLAGDLLPNASKEQIIATAFNRNHKITQEGGVISEEYRAEYVSDRTNTFGTAFLGLTMECAKCHDHKYDPISQQEYFEVFSFFNHVDEKGLIENYGDIPQPYIEISKDEIEETLTFINNVDTLSSIPLLVMKELEKPRDTYILNRGLYDQPTTRVTSNVPSFGQAETKAVFSNRLDLAQWLVDKSNPLFARVYVNRLWQSLFGTGIVATSFDFGNQGALPTHPELLDHLAVKFRTEGWNIRSLVKYIVTSSTYQQSSKVTQRMLEIDPENKYLARANRSRLTAEMIRDHALSISGLLVQEVGGPSVKPYQPEGLWNEVAGEGSGAMANYVQDKGPDNYRRSLYTFWKRTVPPPNMMMFDTPTRDFCTVQREDTSTPLQALVLLNDPQYLEASKALAYRAITQTNDVQESIDYMFYLATSRKASQSELESLTQLYHKEKKHYVKNPEAAQAMLGYGNIDTQDIEDVELATHSYIANTILNLDETIRKS